MKTITETNRCPRCDKLWGAHSVKVSYDEYKLVQRLGGERVVTALCADCAADVERQQRANKQRK